MVIISGDLHKRLFVGPKATKVWLWHSPSCSPCTVVTSFNFCYAFMLFYFRAKASEVERVENCKKHWQSTYFRLGRIKFFFTSVHNSASNLIFMILLKQCGFNCWALPLSDVTYTGSYCRNCFSVLVGCSNRSVLCTFWVTVWFKITLFY